MKHYSLVLFDIDGTLFDFEKSEEYALSKVFESYGMEASQDLIERYKICNAKWWKMFEEGKVEKASIEAGRFVDYWGSMNLDIDPAQSGKRYTDNLADSVFVIDGAEEICRLLSKKARLAIVTNGIARVQYARISASGIGQYLSEIIVSEDVGAAKPDQRFFETALKSCGHTSKEDVIIIGDSLYADIKGGNDFGIDTCWVNYNDAVNNTDIKSTYTIRHLRELEEIVL